MSSLGSGSVAGGRAVAAFDLDGTLTQRDCVTPFLLSYGRLRLARALLRAPLVTVSALASGDRDRLKAVATRALAGLDARAVDRDGEAFAARIIREWLRGDTVARLDAHRERGDRVVIVSASYAPYVEPLARLLGAEAALCTRLEAAPDGRLTGRIEGANCRGEEKARRLRAWLAERGLERAELWAYGDSEGDDAMLALADHPTRVGATTLGPLAPPSPTTTPR